MPLVGYSRPPAETLLSLRQFRTHDDAMSERARGWLLGTAFAGLAVAFLGTLSDLLQNPNCGHPAPWWTFPLYADAVLLVVSLLLAATAAAPRAAWLAMLFGWGATTILTVFTVAHGLQCLN
jgi:hypothetical protein